MEYRGRIRETLGTVKDARFTADGRSVVVLDRHSPHLRLYTRMGELLWSGGYAGDGPFEIQPGTVGFTAALAVDSGSVAVIQRGRLTTWSVASDSLLRRWTKVVPAGFDPRGLVHGCDGQLLLYGLERQRIYDESAAVEYLHALNAIATRDGVLQSRAVWTDTAGLTNLFGNPHTGPLVSRRNGSLVLLHFTDIHSPRRLLEFDCSVRLQRVHEEMALIGDQLQGGFQMMSPGGITALADGFLVGILRPARRPEPISTEIYRFRDGRPQGSTLIRNLWRVMDYHRDAGLLLATDRPEPHFIVLPTAAVCWIEAGTGC